MVESTIDEPILTAPPDRISAFPRSLAQHPGFLAGISILEDCVDENRKNDLEKREKDLEKQKKDPEKRKQDLEDVRKTESRRGRRPIDLDARRKRNELLNEMHKLLLIETEEELLKAMWAAGLRDGSPQFEEVLRIWRENPI